MKRTSIYSDEKIHYYPLIHIWYLIRSNCLQETITFPNPNDSRVITTGVPFLCLIASDATSSKYG